MIARQDDFDLSRDAWLVASSNDEAVGFALVCSKEAGSVYESFAVVDPLHRGRGLGGFLLRELDGRSEQLASDAGHGIVVRNLVMEVDHSGRGLVEGAGYRVVRRDDVMILKPETDPGSAIVPAGFSIRSCSPADARVVHRLVEESFRDHWGWAPITFEKWEQRFVERADTRPDLWFVALEGATPVGVALCTMNDSEGWVATLGVLSQVRRKGIGRALLIHAFRALRAEGAGEICLAVDSENVTGAFRLYERTGMTRVKAWLTYEKKFG